MPSDPYEVFLPPTKPTDILVSSYNGTTFTLSWSGGLSATSYSFVVEPSIPQENISVDVANKTVTLSDLTELTTYVVTITSVNANGTASSEPLTVLPPPSMPFNLVSSAVDKIGFTISWSGGESATWYTYSLNGRITVPSVDNGVLSKIAVFSDLQPGVTYTVIVTARNNTGANSSHGLSVMTTAPPGIMIDPSQNKPTSHLLWNAPIINETVNTTPVPEKVVTPGEGGYANPEALVIKKKTLANGPKSATSSKMTLDGTVTITWEPSENLAAILGYGLILRPSSGGPPIRPSAYPSLTSLTISGLDPTLTYTCEISAVNQFGWSKPRVFTNVITAI